MDEARFQQRSEALGALLQSRLRIRAKAFPKQLRKARPQLPRALRPAVQTLLETQPRLAHPKLARMVAADRVDRAFDQLTKHLKGLDASDRRKGAILGTLAAMVFNLLLLAALLVGFATWLDLF